MPHDSKKLVQRPSTVVEEDTTLPDSACTESEETEPLQPSNWEAVIARIKQEPGSFYSIMVLGVRKVSGIYKCMGVINNRPYFKKRNVDYVIWYDEKEEIWSLTDSSALNQHDPELYGYLDSTAWDLTKVSKSKNWCLANKSGKWIEKAQMRIKKVERSEGFLSGLLTNPVPETRQAAQAAVEQSVSLMSSFWSDFKKVKRNVKENTHCINKLRTKQDIIKTKQRDILGRLEDLEKERKSGKFDDLLHKVKQVEGQVQILSKGRKRNGRSPTNRKKSRLKQSIEDLIRENSLEKATVGAMRAFLKKKQKQQILIDDKQIVLQGNKSTLLNRIKQLLEKPEERGMKNDDDDQQNENQKVVRRKLQKAREQRALARQKKKEQLLRSTSIRPREPADELQRISKKRRKLRSKKSSENISEGRSSREQ